MPAASSSTDVPASDDKPTRLGKFIQTYHSFLSTFVIGAAGLVATSIWQYKQSEIARRQADSQQQIAAAQAENSWRIERAEILSKNLQVLSSSGQGTVEQRFGVLLSLTRGSILDPELAVSYALELGKDNADYMKSVLASTPDKSYVRLANAFELTCQQRFGLTRDVPVCASDKQAERSTAIAELFAQELEAAHGGGHAGQLGQSGPLELLRDERAVQAAPTHLAWLFAPHLENLYERRQLAEITRFEQLGPGAKLISALVLGPTPASELVAPGEAAELESFHDERVKWLQAYLLGPSCGAECKSKLVDNLLSSYAQAHGRFDAIFRALLEQPRGQVASALARLRSRLRACQLDDAALRGLRDDVLVPQLAAAVSSNPKNHAEQIDELLGLLSLMAEPQAAADDPAAQLARKAFQDALDKTREALHERFVRVYEQPRAAAQALRRSPSPALAKVLFCSAAESSTADLAPSED